MSLFAKTLSNDADFTGIQAIVRIPDSWTVPDPDDFINFYIGFDEIYKNKETPVEEAGISYGHNTGSWHYFANPGITPSKAFASQPKPGDHISLMLVNNGDGSLSFWVNGWLKLKDYKPHNPPGLDVTTKVKMVCAGYDCPPTNDVSHTLVVWSSVQVLLNGQWVNWDSSILYTYSQDPSGRYSEQQELPLEAKLSK